MYGGFYIPNIYEIYSGKLFLDSPQPPVGTLKSEQTLPEFSRLPHFIAFVSDPFYDIQLCRTNQLRIGEEAGPDRRKVNTQKRTAVGRDHQRLFGYRKRQMELNGHAGLTVFSQTHYIERSLDRLSIGAAPQRLIARIQNRRYATADTH